MPATTITTIINRAKALSDMHDNFVTNTEWLAWANQEVAGLHLLLARSGWVLNSKTLSGLIVSSNSWTVTRESPIATDAGVSVATTRPGYYELKYNSTEKIMAVVCVHEVASDGTVRQLTFDNNIEFLVQTPASTNSTSHARKYALQTIDDQIFIRFYPLPVANETYLVTYIPAPVVLSAITDSINFPMGWEERIVLGLARRALIKEESDPSKLEQMIREMESQIEELCWSRVLGENPAMRNVDNRIYGWSDRIAFPPWQQWAWI